MNDNNPSSIKISDLDFPGLSQGADSAAAYSLKDGKTWHYKLIPEDAVAANVDFKFAMAQAIKII